MVKTTCQIPKRRLQALTQLSQKLAQKRIVLDKYGKAISSSKSNHAAYLIEDKGGPKLTAISYGENHSRGRRHVSIHAEHDTLRNIRKNHISEKKSYAMLVIKISNSGSLFGNSNSCLRCQSTILRSPLNISRVYYSTPTGIEMGKPGTMTPHLCEFDRHQLELSEECHCEDDEEGELGD